MHIAKGASLQNARLHLRHSIKQAVGSNGCLKPIHAIALRALQSKSVLIWLSSVFPSHFGKNCFQRRRSCGQNRRLPGDGTFRSGRPSRLFRISRSPSPLPGMPLAFFEKPLRPRTPGALSLVCRLEEKQKNKFLLNRTAARGTIFMKALSLPF